MLADMSKSSSRLSNGAKALRSALYTGNVAISYVKMNSLAVRPVLNGTSMLSGFS